MSFSNSDSILVTGGNGMLALALRKRLPAAHFADKNSLDIADENSVRNFFARFKPRILINCAAYTKVDQAEQEKKLANQINGNAVGTLAKICREQGTMLVHFSTDYVFDSPLRRPLRVDDPLSPRSAYGQSKLLGEQLLQQNAPPDWLIIRTAWLYGPGGPSFPQTILSAARAAKPLAVVDDQVGSPTFSDDLADATLQLLDRNARGIFHVANDGQTSWHDFAAAILEEFAVPAKLSRSTSEQWKSQRPISAIRPFYSVLDLSKFQAQTGHRPPPWRDALKRYHLAVG
jgi:dTDP-4-dehydrorhamnose reductase